MPSATTPSQMDGKNRKNSYLNDKPLKHNSVYRYAVGRPDGAVLLKS